MTTQTRHQRYMRKAQRESASKARLVKATKTKELAASKALAAIFHTRGRSLKRVILNKGYLILSYLTPYNHILQSYFILVRHHL